MSIDTYTTGSNAASMSYTTARDLTNRLKRAYVQCAVSEDHFSKTEEKLKKEEIALMKKEEQQFIADVVHIDRHKSLKNPYELKIERGKHRS